MQSYLRARGLLVPATTGVTVQQATTATAGSGRWIWVMPLATLVLGLFFLPRAPLLTAYLAALGIVIALYWTRRAGQARRGLWTTQVERLVTLARAHYLREPSARVVLCEAVAAIEGPVRQVVEQALRRADLSTVGVGQALVTEAQVLGEPGLTQLALILAQDARPVDVNRALDELEGRLHQQRRLRGKVRTALALQQGTVRVLQGANAFGVVFCVLMPLWRDFYESSLDRQVMFMLVTVVMALASAYFDQQILALQEQAL
ncbi:MAG: hypothetical protein KKA73_29300 [Chloroflexi bacterium]|nr:hypothetical protein [Chloroflexota bacterium]MBU1751793.1 hypothetical protein [Chloroflexota bacterium]